MSGISAIYILDQKGRILITRAYRADTPTNIHESFNKKILEYDENTLLPVLIIEEVVFCHTRYNNLLFLAVSKKNSNVLMIFAFLYKLIDVFIEYFKELEEESIRDNFVIIYELLDEMMDNGYPQLTENITIGYNYLTLWANSSLFLYMDLTYEFLENIKVKILQEYIKTEYHQLKDEKKDLIDPNKIQVPTATTNVVSWRQESIKYKKNEIFLDVIEKLNIIIGPNGNVIKSEILGRIKMKSFLSGMPELKLGLNDKTLFEAIGRKSTSGAVDLDDIKFHQCVRLAKFENDRTISFVPPDKESELMSYRLDMHVNPLFTVDTQFDFKSSTRIEYNIRAKSNYKTKYCATIVEIIIPVPCDVHTPVFKTANGNVVYNSEKEAMVWTIKQFHGQKEMAMKATFSLPSIVSSERQHFQKIPINVIFELPYFTISGINVRYLKITEKSGYTGLPWVRYITENGDYQIRMI